MNISAWRTTALALIAGFLAAPAHAAEVADTADSGMDDLIVTGTRQTGIRAVDSAAPVQVIDAGALERTGQADLRLALANLTPSFTAQAFGGDTANLTLSARLRGVSPNQTLVLINGKRRHGTANLAVLSGPYQGSAAADLNFIPLAAIERVEVLTDGAGAQYGTDAIAGVINLILKDDASGGVLSGTGGAYIQNNDGETFSLSANIGFQPFESAFFNLTFESRFHDYSFRGREDARIVDRARVAANPTWPSIIDEYPYANRIAGDARYHLNVGTFSAGFSPSEGVNIYSFGTYGVKKASAFENYRLPTSVPAVYPAGYSPREETLETDYALTFGIKGENTAGWSFDLSSTYGKDDHDITVANSANVQLYQDTGSTPTDFHAGDFIGSQWTNNLDINGPVAIGLAEPLNVAFGLEQRSETYEIKPGDPASRYKAGSQSYPGFALSDAGSYGRDNWAAYIDLGATLFEKLKLEVAARHEDFSDFGSTDIAKLTARFDFSPSFAVRGTASTGFRAPTLAELNYSATNVSPTTATVQLAPSSVGARLLGVDGLEPEESTNFSAGIVAKAFDRLTLTIDAYQIEITDRIVGSGTVNGTINGVVVNSAIVNAITANGNSLDPTVTTTGISIFSNGLDTRTTGLEILASTYFQLGEYGKLNLTFGANFNETEVTDIAAPPSGLGGATLYTVAALANLESAAPEYKLNLAAVWSVDRWTINLVNTLYGPSFGYTTVSGNFYKDEIDSHLITDIDFGYQITDNLKASVGANNVFDIYPEERNPASIAAEIASGAAATTRYPTFSPFGINGGYYYGKMTYSF